MNELSPIVLLLAAERGLRPVVLGLTLVATPVAMADRDPESSSLPPPFEAQASNTAADAPEPADAQPPSDSTGTGVEEIVVTAQPIRDSLEESLQEQREAPNVVNVIASDTIGRFPDVTAAAALARLPGVAVQRDQGQERFIQIRGGPARWAQTSFDGVNVLGAEDRAFRFDSVPAALIDSVEVNKTLTPDMSAEALSGRVNIKTYSALDNPGWNGQAQVGFGEIDLADGPQESYSGRLSWGNERFGVVLSGSHFEFEQQADNTEPRYDDQGLRQIRGAKYVTVRETNALSAKLEMLLTPVHRLSFTSLFAEFNDDEQRHEITFDFDEADSGTRDQQSGDLVAVPTRQRFGQGDYSNSTFYNVFAGDHELGRWRGQWQLAYTETEETTNEPLLEQFAADPTLRPSVRIDARTPNMPLIRLSRTERNGQGNLVAGAPLARFDQRAYDTDLLGGFGGRSESEAYTFKADLQREWGTASTFSAGLQFDLRDYSSPGSFVEMRPDGTQGTLDLRSAAAELGLPWRPFDFITDARVDESFNRGYDWNYYDADGIRAHMRRIQDAAEAANAAGSANYAVRTFDPAQFNEVEEDIFAGYLMNNWEWGRHGLLAGVRVESVGITSSGNLSTADPDGGAATRTPISQDNDYTDLFPSVHWNYNITDALKYRLSGTSGAARPSFDELRANATVNDGDAEVSGGNPRLEPESAVGVDTSLEWYFAPASLLAFNAFYRDVDDVLFESSTSVGDARFDSTATDRSDYQFFTTLNGEAGELYGVEFTYNHALTFLPSVLAGFGIQGSVTLLDGSFDTPDGREVDFPGTSDRITNLSVFYENYGASIRVSYQHRTEWLDSVGSNAQSDRFWGSVERVDLSARYAITQSLSVYFDANNLTDELGRRYQPNANFPYEIESFGRRYLVGVRANFGV